MGSSFTDGAADASEQAIYNDRPADASEQAINHDRPFPITEIHTADGNHNTAHHQQSSKGLLRFLSYRLPWVAWLINVALLITPQYQKADVSLCIQGEYLQEQLMATGATSTVDMCEFRVFWIGLVTASEETSSSPGFGDWSVEVAVNDLADDDWYNNLSMGAAIVPVALGFLLMCLCCGPVLLGEFQKGQVMLWNIASLVFLLSALFSGLTMLFVRTDICQEQQICQAYQDDEQYSTVASSIIGYNNAIDAAANDFTTMEIGCQQTCSIDAGFYLSIVTTAMWSLAFLGTVMLKKASATKIHP